MLFKKDSITVFCLRVYTLACSIDVKSHLPDTYCIHTKLLQLCPTLFDSMDCSPLGSSVHRILHARILEWVASPPPGPLPNPGI